MEEDVVEKSRKWRPFPEARDFVQALHLKSQAEWRAYCKAGEKPGNIPRVPDKVYGTEFQGWGDWLGTGRIANQNRIYRSFAEARSFVHQLGLKNEKAWRVYCKSGEKPEDIPANPRAYYPSEFAGLGDWLGTGTPGPQDHHYRSFPEARSFVHALHLKNAKEWVSYCQSGEKPADIPGDPRTSYRSEFSSWGDWLGTGAVSTHKRHYRSFSEAQNFVRQLHLKNHTEWRIYCQSGEKPDDIPTNPRGAYKDDFQGWGDWLGTGNVAKQKRRYRSFPEARAFTRSLGLHNSAEWRDYCLSGKRPEDIPSNPDKVYHSEFQGYGDWLGTGTIANQKRSYRPFVEARTFARQLGLQKSEQWSAYCASGQKPEDIPASPSLTYGSEFQGYGDWLGTGNVSRRYRRYRPFPQARAFVRALGLKNQAEWQQYCRFGNKPDDIPSNPHTSYRAEFRGMGDWLGTGTIAPGNYIFRPFAEARSFIHSLGLKNQAEWQQYCRFGNKPDDIPSNPHRSYRSEFRNMGDWLGTGTIAPRKRTYRSFAEARDFVRRLALGSSKAWSDYCASGNKPNDIPSNPQHVYRAEFRGMGDWLGTGTIAPGLRSFRSFSAARDFARGLGLRNEDEWRAYCKSGEKPEDIPWTPAKTYRSEYQGMGDWLGTGNVRPRSFRSFVEARAFVQQLRLRNEDEWRVYCKSGEKPEDIPAGPAQAYHAEFKGMGDWLGTGTIANKNRTYRSFVDARAFVRSLALKSGSEWLKYCWSGERPEDIPARPQDVYALEYRGLGDWLGVVNRWTKNALLALLDDLRLQLDQLEERELYIILQQGSALSSLRMALGGSSPWRVLQDLQENDGRELEQALRALPSDALIGAADNALAADVPLEEVRLLPVLELAHDFEQESPLPPGAQAPLEEPPSDVLEAGLPTLVSPESLRVIDALSQLSCGLDETAAEYLVANRVSALWEAYIHHGRSTVDALLANSGGYWFQEIRSRFLSELEGVENLVIPTGWSFTAFDGLRALPNKMQRRTAWAVREKRRVGNWSGVGAGKTLSAILASRVIGARLTLVITNNATTKGWGDQIRNAYPDSMVYFDISGGITQDSSRHTYVVLNYEKFQGRGRHDLVLSLFALRPDFIVLDEVQFVKQREAQVSNRRQALGALVGNAAQANSNLCVLGMSATPVINSLTEAKALLEIVTGQRFPELEVGPTINNALAVHQALMLHGFRYRPRYEQEMRTKIITATRNDLLGALYEAQKSVLQIEQILLPAKLELAQAFFRPGTIVYAHYVDEIVAPIRAYLENRGFSVGLYTGVDKSGLDQFRAGKKDILLGTSPVGTGLDGLQKVCNRLVMLSLPWTGAEYEQIIGRIRRQGSQFGEVEIILPQIMLDYRGERWSWDQGRLAVINYKRTLSDCALDGCIPETMQIHRHALLQQGREALERWIERIGQDGLLALERAQLAVPLPPQMLQKSQVHRGDFTALNQRWSASQSTTTHERLQQDASEWHLYHTHYRETREKWPEQPFEKIAGHICLRPDWRIGDFGCGECLLRQALPHNAVVSIDHIAWDEQVIACDMASTPLEDVSLDAVVFCLSLMGVNWEEYLKEAYRTLKPYGYLFIAEPQKKWQDRLEELKEAVSAAHFQLLGEIEQRYGFLYLTALKR